MDTFEYTYSAKKQEEIEKIRNKYVQNEPDAMEKLRKLDRSAEIPGTIAATIIGIVGTLVFGAGMSMSIVWAEKLLIPGIICGVLGMIIMGLALPIYRIITKNQRKKIAPLILELSNELLK